MILAGCRGIPVQFLERAPHLLRQAGANRRSRAYMEPAGPGAWRNKRVAGDWADIPL